MSSCFTRDRRTDPAESRLTAASSLPSQAYELDAALDASGRMIFHALDATGRGMVLALDASEGNDIPRKFTTRRASCLAPLLAGAASRTVMRSRGAMTR
ncbi:hypothetical protein ACHAWF_007738 [Thalassiosira exigua]